jgi:carbonic anhydrase/acetyltransferase-like protein (isoleucine patch superfamily)
LVRWSIFGGEVEVGRRAFVARNAVLQADEGLRVGPGEENNRQDSASLPARQNNRDFGVMARWRTTP